MEPKDYFEKRDIPNKKKYDALRAFFLEKRPAEEVAHTYGYSLSSVYSLTRDFRNHLKQNPQEDLFFKDVVPSRKESIQDGLEDMAIGLRKHNFSIEDDSGDSKFKRVQSLLWLCLQAIGQGRFCPLAQAGAAGKEKAGAAQNKSARGRRTGNQRGKIPFRLNGYFYFPSPDQQIRYR
jgi:hypothetical protein